MRIVFFTAVAVVGLAQAAMADSSDPLNSSDKRIQIMPYEETEVYTITTRYGYQTNIVFGPNEEVETISVGDRSPWQIIPSGNRIFIRPMQEDVITNMTVLTNKHSYQFDLKSLAMDITEGNIYVAQFAYQKRKSKLSNEALITAPASNASPSVSDSTLSTGSSAPPNYNYTYSGADALAPQQVYDDGKYTYIRYQAAMLEPLPSVFTVDSRGQETPVNFAVKEDTLRVSVVSGEILLKNKDGEVRIFNEKLNPG